jgi:RNA-splicing ligase RtcB
VVHAALGLARRGQLHRHDVHRAGEAGRDAPPGNLPDRDLAYFEEGSRYFGDYVRAVGWAQKFARLNREVMMKRVIEAAKTVIRKNFQSHIEAVNCHHNYVQKEHHFGEDVYVTRKGAVSAKAGQLGIIPAAWARAATSCAARATRSRSSRARTARAA